jgi:hypothetical protein
MISKSRFLIVVAVLALAGCAGVPGDGAPSSLPAGALQSSVLKPGTVFVAIGEGALPGSVVFSAPPYTSRGETRPSQSPLAVALTQDDALIVADDADAAPLSIIRPPYVGPPKTIARFSWAGGMALDKSGNIFLAQARMPNSRSSYIKEYRAPDYARSVRFASSTNRSITSVTALPDGELAVGGVLSGPHDTFLPGSLDIYRAPFTHGAKIAALPFVQAMTVVPNGLIVLVCSQCYGNASSGSYLALVAPPYTSVTKILATMPNVSATSVASSPAGDVFVNQGGVLYHYAPPYSKDLKLSKTSGVLEGAVATGPSGDLFFGSTSQPGIDGSFTIFRLPAPYGGKPQALFSTPGVPGGITVSR